MTVTAKWTAAQQRIALLLKSDGSVTDAPRVMRVPGFINTKPKYPHRPRVQLHEANRERRYELAVFLPDHSGLTPAPAGKKLNHLGEVAAAFHGLWNKGKDDARLRFILPDDAETTLARMALVRATATVIASGLAVMGVKPVEELRE